MTHMEQVPTAVTVPLTDAQKLATGEAAAALEKMRTQGYMDSTVAAQVLAVVKELLPLALGVLGL